ncbi:bifunctional diguanylate cyclase/phosphodiesterase [Massilia sp. DWR3-1-1]|uniref:bifunctional diguanylate cyclase/phosphodiesterase n=1 Tax=Massilia sp. DWR3-1-1 TaxID=2804559 RepID=UPI003CF4334A
MPTFKSINLFHRLFWPVLALLVCAVMWYFTLSRGDTELVRAEQVVQREAAALAEAYEQYITRSVGQMDQITMQLKHSAEHADSPHLLERLKRDGMFTDEAFVAVSIIGADGVLRSSTQDNPTAINLASTGFFIDHRNNISSALRIGAVPPELSLRHDALLFTRRLDTSSDEFAGVVLMAVNARYFTGFVGADTLGARGMVAMAARDGGLRVEQRGDGAARVPSAAVSLLPVDDALWSADRGVRLAPAQGEGAFSDGVARVLAWRHSSAYPLVALVGLGRDDALAAVHQSSRDGRATAMLSSVLLFVLAVLASVLAARAAARMREQEEVRSAYRTATESANDGFYMVAAVRDRHGIILDFEIVDCNERGAFFYGMPRTDLLGRRLSHIDRGRFGDDLVGTYREAMENGFYEDDRRMPTDNRLNIRWGHRRLVRVGNGLAVTLQDVSERKAHEAELERLANEDSLTGLRNRHWFLGYIEAAIALARTDEVEFAVLFIDLDDFKHVNDTQGHAVGDQLLKAVARRLGALLRPGDHVVRFGGDEFIVLLAPTGGDLQIAAVAGRIVDALSAPFSIADDVQVVGASIGISVFPRDGGDAGTLIKHSDIAMYAGKSEGKGQFRFFDPALSATIKTRARLKHGLLAAISEDQFLLYYQPRVDTHTGELVSMEALLRWRHPLLGMVAPGDFIPLAEQSGLILPIGAMVIDKACAQLAAWRAAGHAPVPVSINVSPSQFQRGGVRQQLEDALQRHRVAPDLLEVEITESAMIGDQDAIVAELAAIRALGIKLHIDDFGTGYSSLSQLQRLKMDVLKVDRAFTAALGTSREGKVFFRAIVSMAHALGMAVVAEGVETAAQLKILQQLGCNEVQGYFVARPMPADDIAPLLTRRYLFATPALVPELVVPAQP